jgi:hypothetical protein
MQSERDRHCEEVLFIRLQNTVKMYGTQSCGIIRGCIQKFPDWPPATRSANGTALCHLVQLYHYFVSQSSEVCRHNTLCCFSTSVYCCCCCLFLYRLSPETFGYTRARVCVYIFILPNLWPTQPPIQWVPGALSLGVKRPGREADHSPSSNAEVEE